MNLDRLLERADLWRGRSHAPTRSPHLATGHPGLDERLGGGWPLGALTELLVDQQGIGELHLLLPALARLSRQRWLLWVAPPHIPYAPALAEAGLELSRFLWVRSADPKEALWVQEQALRSGACGAVLGWPKAISGKALRRLQLAAEQGQAWGVLFRPRREAAHPSPAALRLELASAGGGLSVRVVKRRGGWDDSGEWRVASSQ